MILRRPRIIDSGALLSRDELYRYRLWRRWGKGACMTFIGLNPSTADASKDDHTIRKCMGFAIRNGCEAIEMLNLFAFRATKPSDLKAAVKPIGSKNDETLLSRCQQAEFVIACWGINGKFKGRAEYVVSMLQNHGVTLQCLGMTKQGLPRHPVMCQYAKPRANSRGIIHPVNIHLGA